MNIDSNEILLFSTQCASDIVKEYGILNDINALKENATYLLSEISSYLSEDGADVVVRKCAVQWQSGLLISQARKIPLVSDDARKVAENNINHLHKNFIAQCRENEHLFVQTRNKIEHTSSRPLKM